MSFLRPFFLRSGISATVSQPATLSVARLLPVGQGKHQGLPQSLAQPLHNPLRTSAAQSAIAAQAREDRNGQRRNKAELKIADHFVQLEAAQNKRSNTGSTREFMEKRMLLDQKRDALHAARMETPDDKKRIREIKREKDALKQETRTLYTRGPLGLSDEELKEKRRQQYVPASFDGLHAAFGARLFSGLSGIGGLEISSAGGKTALQQGLGGVTQSGAAGILRMATDIVQVRAGKAGKPRLPENLAAKGNFKQSYRSMEQAKKTLLAARDALQAALVTAHAHDTPDNRLALRARKDEVAGAIADLLKFEGAYDNLCIMLEKEFRGKKASAAVSVLSALMSGGAYALEPTGAAAVAGHKLLCLGGLLLQLPMSAMDYMDGTIDYPQHVSADKIDLKLLVRESSRGKPLEELGEDDFDASIAARLYDEKPQLVQEVIRATYRHELSRLNAARLRVKCEIEQGKLSRLPLCWKSAASQHRHAEQKNRELDMLVCQVRELETQIVLYEQHQRYQLDPRGLIGKSISDPLYFCRKGISASVFNKVGEFFSQANERIANNFSPLFGLGLVSIGQGIVANEVGISTFHDGMHSMAGSVARDTQAEAAMLGMAGAQAAGAASSSATSISARAGRAEDRRLLETPRHIARGQGVNAADKPRARIEQALELGIISERKHRKLGKALDILDSHGGTPGTPAVLAGQAQARLRKAEKKWDKFRKHCEEVDQLVAQINEDWIIEPKDEQGKALLDHAGKPIVIDLRQTADCLASYMPLLERAWVPLKTLPKSVLRSVTFWKDVIQARRAADECRPLVDRGQVRDPQLQDLIAQANTVLQGAATPDKLELKFLSEAGKDKDEDFTLDNMLGLLERHDRPMQHALAEVAGLPAAATVSPASPAGTASPAELPPAYGDPAHAIVPPSYGEAFGPQTLGRIAALKQDLLDLGSGLDSRDRKGVSVMPVTARLSDMQIARQAIAVTDGLLALEADTLSRLEPGERKSASDQLSAIRTLLCDVRDDASGKSQPAVRTGISRGRLARQEFERYRMLLGTVQTLDMALERTRELDHALARVR